MPRNKNGLDWRGKAVKAAVLEAARKGIDETMGECVVDAQADTPVDTGAARRSVAPQSPATVYGSRVVGLWGSKDVEYFIWLEIGTSTRGGHHMLTNAADREYPHLAARIKGNLAA